jgi:prolyl-tRNA synthetase
MSNQELRTRMQDLVDVRAEQEKGLREDLLTKIISEPDRVVAEKLADSYNKSGERDKSNAMASGVISVLDDDMLGKIESEVRSRHENSYQRLTSEGVVDFILEDRCKEQGIQRTSTDITMLRSRDVAGYDAKPSRFEYKVEPVEAKNTEDVSKKQQMSYGM